MLIMFTCENCKRAFHNYLSYRMHFKAFGKCMTDEEKLRIGMLMRNGAWLYVP